MSTNRSVGRSASTQEKDRSAYKPKKDRSPNLCAFTFADGRQCRTPRRSGHLHLCYFHAQKEAESLAAQQVGQDISRFLPTKLLTACDLGVAMSRLFCAVARGEVKPKVAATLAYLAQTMLQSIPIAQHEYCESLGTDYWHGAIRSSFNVPAPEPEPAPKPQPAPQSAPSVPPPAATSAGCHSERSEESAFLSPSAPSHICHPERSEGSASSSTSPPDTHHSFTPSKAEGPLPQPPHTPLPPTITEFAHQVLAGRNSSRSEIPTPSGPVRDPSSSASSSSTPAVRPQAPVNCHSACPDLVGKSAARPEEPASSSNSSLATHPSPLPHDPAPVSPNSCAPANCDALIPPKPRRRFSRHWHLLE